MLPTWVVSLLQAGRITRYTAIIETPEHPSLGALSLVSFVAVACGGVVASCLVHSPPD